MALTESQMAAKNTKSTKNGNEQKGTKATPHGAK
jgi:hypothetical protein